MPEQTFDDLAEQFCALLQVPVPDMPPDADGVRAFSTRLQDVDVSVAHDPVRAPGYVLVVVAFGALPAARTLEAARALLHANLLMFQPGAPAFSLNPVDGLVLLQRAHPLERATGAGLLAALDASVRGALQWRRDHYLEPAGTGDGADAVGQRAVAAVAGFV